MPPFQAHNTFAILFSALLFTPALASPQALPSTTTSTPTSTYSYQETSMATIPPSYIEYNFTYPVHEFLETIDNSYKDTIDVSWTVIAPNHLPILQIECWLRNDSSWVNHPPDLSINILNLTDPTMTNVQIALEPYKAYDLCQFSMIDSQNRTLTDHNGANSGDFAISDTNNSKGQIWSLDNTAPVVSLTATAKNAAPNMGMRGVLVSAVSVAALGSVLLSL